MNPKLDRYQLLDVSATEDPAKSTVTEKADQIESKKTISDVLSARLLPAESASAAPIHQDRGSDTEEEMGKASDKNETSFGKKGKGLYCFDSHIYFK